MRRTQWLELACARVARLPSSPTKCFSISATIEGFHSVNAARVCHDCGQPFQPKADHSTYLHENKAKTTKMLFPACYTQSRTGILAYPRGSG